jgi:hypothetical protein
MSGGCYDHHNRSIDQRHVFFDVPGCVFRFKEDILNNYCKFSNRNLTQLLICYYNFSDSGINKSVTLQNVHMIFMTGNNLKNKTLKSRH